GYIFDFFSSSFGVRSGQIDRDTATKVINEAFEFLLEDKMMRMVDGDGWYAATSLGHMVNRMYINPTSMPNITKALQEANSRIHSPSKDVADFSWLHMMCTMVDWSFRPIRWEDFQDDIDFENLLLGDDSDRFEEGLEGALVLRDYILEIEEKQICERFHIGSGDLALGRDNARWMLYSVRIIAEVLGYSKLLGQLDVLIHRIEKGIKEELLSLTSIKGIGRSRARKLFEAGITGRQEFFSGKDYLLISQVIGVGVLKRVLEENNVDPSKVNVDLTITRQTILG
ncbi:MAG: hypothetical protein ACRDF4_02235, partial [Rhabdochlamydiaceae bacterium]